MALLPRCFFIFLLFLDVLRCCAQGPPADAAGAVDVLTTSVRRGIERYRQRLIVLYGGFDAFDNTNGVAENVDPQTADPSGKVSCWGRFDAGAIRSDSPPGVDFSLLMAQHICAKPQYGGDLRLHIGAWCRLGPHGGEVVFDPSIDAGPNRDFDSLETKTFCLQRCYCDQSVPPLPGPPKRKDYQIRYHPRSETYMIQGLLRIGRNRELPPKGSGTDPTIALAIINQKQAVASNSLLRFSTQYVSLSPAWNISCPGSQMPEWLPAGWSSSDFQGRTQRLCAAVFNGGNP